MAIKDFNEASLQWNIHTKVIWASKKILFLERFKKMDFIPSANNGWNVPAQVGAELQAFIDAIPDNPVIKEIAFDLTQPENILYGLKAHYANCDVMQYLHSNGLRVSLVAFMQIPHLVVIKSHAN